MNRARWLTLFGCASLLVTSCAQNDSHVPAKEASARLGALALTTIQVDTTSSLTTNGNFQGFGIHEDTNQLWLGANTGLGVAVPGDWEQFVRPRLKALKPALVRKFIDLNWFAATQGVYTWNSAGMQGLYTTLQELKTNAVPVILTIWVTPTYMSSRNLGGVPRFPSPETNPDYADRWATAVTDLMKHLYGADGSGYTFDNIKFLGGPNELETTSVGELVRPYQLLDQKLSAANIRSAVTLFGPDMADDNGTAGTQAIVDAKNNPLLAPLLGMYDFHEYQSGGTDAGVIRNFDAARAAVQGTGKQVFVTEIGEQTSGNNDWRTLPTWAIDALNHGQAAVIPWTFMDQVYCGGTCTSSSGSGTSATLDGGKWGLLGFKDTGYAPKTSYYMWSAITQHTQADSVVYSNSCSNEQCTGLRVATLRNQAGNHTIILNNLSSTAAPVSFEYAGQSPTQVLYRYTINPASLPDPSTTGDTLGYDQILQMTGGRFSDTVPAGAFVVYSSLNPQAPANNPGNFPNGNLTLGKSYSSSSNWDANQSADKAFDGLLSTNWQAGDGTSPGLGFNNSTLEVNLGSNTPFNQAVITEYDNRTTGFRLEYWNGSSWQVAYTGTAIGNLSTPLTVSFPTVIGSKARLVFTSGTTYSPVIYEFELYNRSTATNLALNRSYASSSSWDSSQTADKAFDGLFSTNWQAGYGTNSGQGFNNSTLEVDFGMNTTFDKAVLSEYDNRTTGYHIEYFDGSSWQTAYTGTAIGSVNAPSTVTFSSVTGTKARIVFTSGNQYSPVIYEFELFKQ